MFITNLPIYFLLLINKQNPVIPTNFLVKILFCLTLVKIKLNDQNRHIFSIFKKHEIKHKPNKSIFKDNV